MGDASDALSVEFYQRGSFQNCQKDLGSSHNFGRRTIHSILRGVIGVTFPFLGSAEVMRSVYSFVILPLLIVGLLRNSQVSGGRGR